MGKDFTTYRRRLRKVRAAIDTANREAGRPGRFTGNSASGCWTTLTRRGRDESHSGRT